MAQSLDQIGLPKTATTIVDLTLRIFDEHSMTHHPKCVKRLHHHGGDPLSEGESLDDGIANAIQGTTRNPMSFGLRAQLVDRAYFIGIGPVITRNPRNRVDLNVVCVLFLGLLAGKGQHDHFGIPRR